jgi:diguanylate cyclase (GGDEF)-like protein/PAS domain S-box-containing protein
VNSHDSFQRAVLDHLQEGIYFVDRTRTITYWNKAAEKITGFKASEVVGSQCMDNILNHVDESGHHLCFGRCPLAGSLEDGKERQETIYLHHRDGHRVAVDTRVVPFVDDDGRITGAMEIFMESASEALKPNDPQNLDEEAMLDPVTSLWNQHYSYNALKSRLEEAKQFGRRFGVLLIDIDLFGAIRENFGDEISDQVLQMTAATVLNSLRPYDFLSRSADGQFMAMVINTNEGELKHVAERVRVMVEHSSLFRYSDPLKVTVSVGGAMARVEDTAESLLARAGELLDVSREEANRVTIEAPVKVKHQG